MKELDTTRKETSRILALVDWYLPGYKGGGPAVSVSRLAKQLTGEFECFVYTRDRDLGNSAPFADIEVGDWNDRPEGWVYYASPKEINAVGLMKIIEATRPHTIYLNSYFSKMTRAALILRMLGKTEGIAFVLAPRGEFSPGALKLKALRKRLYILAASLLRFHHGVTWQVSSELELKETRAVVDHDPRYYVLAPDLMDPTEIDSTGVVRNPKQAGMVEFAFISRISEKKNLLGAIEMLRPLKGDVRLFVYGPVEDEGYWRRCKDMIRTLPANVKVEYCGPVLPSAVHGILSQHHYFLFPTLGENFGHVIAEALGAGLPTLVSDRAPWLDLAEKDAGWSIPLEEPEEWTRMLQGCVDVDTASYEKKSRNAVEYVIRRKANDSGLKSSGKMFRDAIALAAELPDAA